VVKNQIVKIILYDIQLAKEKPSITKHYLPTKHLGNNTIFEPANGGVWLLNRLHILSCS